MIHLTALVHPTAKIGDGSTIWGCANVLADVILGAGCSIGHGAEIGRGSVLGRDVRVGHGAFLPSNTLVGNRVFIGPGVVMCDDKHPRVLNANYKAQPPVIEADASLGAHCTILPGVRIGRGAMIGAGAVVTHDVEDGATVAGVPARMLEPA